jgi:alkylation response protein AidB-like acyl-CoA dehydrogenase
MVDPIFHSRPRSKCRILSQADSAVGQLLLSHFVLSAAIQGLAGADPAPRIYRDVLDGAQIGNATVERGTRTSVERLTTVTRRDDDTWVLNGKKFYATGALGATWIGVAARIPDTEPSHGATVFVQPADPGVSLNLDRWTSFGQRGTASGEVVLDQVVVDDEFVIDEGPDPDPVTAPPSVLGAFDQALHAAVDIGIARAALEDGARFVTTKTRPWFEAGVDSAAEEPHVVRRFGELTARLYALEALLARGAGLIDEALAAPELTREAAASASLNVAAAKALAQEFAVEIASGIFELAGASATDASTRWIVTGATCACIRFMTPLAGNTSTSATTPCSEPTRRASACFCRPSLVTKGIRNDWLLSHRQHQRPDRPRRVPARG